MTQPSVQPTIARQLDITIERVVKQIFELGTYDESHRQTILLLLDTEQITHRDLDALVRLQAAMEVGEIEDGCVP